jgi:hypothetical protein
MSDLLPHYPLLDWLATRFKGAKHAPPRRSLHELAAVMARLVPLYLQRSKPLRPSAVEKRLLARNLRRAARAAAELGEQSILQVIPKPIVNRTRASR